MRAEKIEFWVSTSNNRVNATKIAESEVGIVVHGGLPLGATRYYWARAIDPDGNESEFYPVSSNAGIAATTLTTAPGADSVGSNELQNNAVQNRHVQSMSADKITGGTISAT